MCTSEHRGKRELGRVRGAKKGGQRANQRGAEERLGGSVLGVLARLASGALLVDVHEVPSRDQFAHRRVGASACLVARVKSMSTRRGMHRLSAWSELTSIRGDCGIDDRGRG
jgi:hypothetical protein